MPQVRLASPTSLRAWQREALSTQTEMVIPTLGAWVPRQPHPSHRPRENRRREINAWLNRRLGIGSVNEAAPEDLERSVDLLVGKLTRRR